MSKKFRETKKCQFRTLGKNARIKKILNVKKVSGKILKNGKITEKNSGRQKNRLKGEKNSERQENVWKILDGMKNFKTAEKTWEKI